MTMARSTDRWLRYALTTLCAALGACTTVPRPGATPPPDTDPLAAWGQVLERHVDDQGLVDYAGLAEDRDDLNSFVAYVYAVSPESHPARFPGRADRLAYYINAYNALAMYNVLESDVPESLAGWTKLDFFVLRRLQVGGERMSLYGFENDVIRPQGDARVHFALNCMAVSCPRLPRTPYLADGLDARLDGDARAFFAEPRNLTVDHEARTVALSEILDFFEEDFLVDAPSLIAYVNRYAGEPIPEGYDVRFFDYDWTVNAQVPPTAGS